MPDDQQLREEAKRFADLWDRLGFQVTWAKKGEKVAKYKGWKTTPNRPGAVYGELKRGEPGVVLGRSGLIGIDCDSKADVERFKALSPPPTMFWNTKQGRHFVYRAPGGVEFHGFGFEHDSVTAWREKILWTPPAIGKTLPDPLLPIVEMPRAVYDRMVELAGHEKERARRAIQGGEKVTAGGRHAFLLEAAGRLARAGISRDVALAELLRLNAEMCDPPKTEAEVEGAMTAYDEWRQDGIETMKAAPTPKVKPKIRTLVGVEPELTRWFPGIEFEGLVPRHGHLVALVAAGGTGKGLWMTQLAASLLPTVTGPMLYLGEEDGDHQLALRMEAADCPPENFHILDRITFPSGLDDFEDAIRVTGAKVAVIDSGAGHLDKGLKTNAIEDVRSVLDLLATMANRTRCTIVVIVHVGKSKDLDAKNRGVGSTAFTDAVRHQLTMAADPTEEVDGEAVRVVEVTKSNIGPTGTRRRILLEKVDVRAKDPETGEWETIQFPKTVDDGPSTKSVEELLAHKASGKEGHARRELERGLQDRPDGWHATSAKKEIAETVDCDQKTVWRAFKQLERSGLAQSVQPGADRGETFWIWTGDTQVDKSGGW